MISAVSRMLHKSRAQNILDAKHCIILCFSAKITKTRNHIKGFVSELAIGLPPVVSEALLGESPFDFGYPRHFIPQS